MKKLISMIIAAVAFSAPALAQKIEIDLGNRDDVEDLFSFPANCNVVCFVDQTLEETVAVYLEDSIRRDGYVESTLEVIQRDGNVIARINGEAGESYAVLLPEFLASGKIGVKNARALHTEGNWRYNWRFYLPLGLAIENNPTVQLLHFPPDYVLEEVQDYLAANTTKRWQSLLLENGAVADTVESYQAIIDIAPISAPSRDGKTLSGTYDDFTPYIESLLEFWTTNGSGQPKPMVAFGSPVRRYLDSQFGLDLDLMEFGILSTEFGEIPTLAANHPSRFYNSLNGQLDSNPNDVRQAVLSGMRMAKDDLVAACWQVETPKRPMDGHDVLSECLDRWSDEGDRICEIVIEQYFVGRHDEDEARTVCVGVESEQFAKISEAELEALDELNLEPVY